MEFHYYVVHPYLVRVCETGDLFEADTTSELEALVVVRAYVPIHFDAVCVGEYIVEAGLQKTMAQGGGVRYDDMRDNGGGSPTLHDCRSEYLVGSSVVSNNPGTALTALQW